MNFMCFQESDIFIQKLLLVTSPFNSEQNLSCSSCNLSTLLLCIDKCLTEGYISSGTTNSLPQYLASPERIFESI